MRAAARRRGDLGGTLDQIRAALDQALAAEREALAGDRGRRRPVRGDGAGHAPRRRRRRRPGAGGLPLALRGGPADVRADHPMLQREVLDAQFAGMKQALECQDPEAMQRVKDMLADLNSLLAAHARNEDTTDAVRRLHGQARGVLPRAAGDRRGADRRAGPPAGGRPADDELAQPGAARAARPADEPGPGRRRPRLGDGAAVGQPARAATGSGPRLPDRDGAGRAVAGLRRGGRGGGRARRPGGAAGTRCRRTARAPPWTTSTSTCWRSGSAARPSPTCRPCATWSASWSSRASCTATDDGLRLTPQAVRRLGQTALQAGVRPDRRGRPRRPRRPPHRIGRRADRADPALGVRRRAADRRAADGQQRAAPRRACSPRGGAVALAVEDFEVTETERRTIGGGGALRRPLVLDGAGRPLGSDEADRPGAEPPDRDAVPAGRAAGDRLQPARPAAVPGAAGRGRAGLDPGHQPAARADAGRPAPAPAPRRRAGGAGRHRRGADRAPAADDGEATFPLAVARRRRSGPPWPRSTS